MRVNKKFTQGKMYLFHLFNRWMEQYPLDKSLSSDYIAILVVSLMLICWIVIYPMDSAIQCLNNPRLILRQILSTNTLWECMKISLTVENLLCEWILPKGLKC